MTEMVKKEELLPEMTSFQVIWEEKCMMKVAFNFMIFSEI